MEESVKQFLTIRQAAKMVGLNHNRIRQWAKDGQVPGFYSGTRFYVNMPKFRKALDAGTVGRRLPKYEPEPEKTKPGERSVLW